MAVVMLSFEKVCRGCLSENNLLAISTMNTFSACVGLDVTPDDDLPKNLCFDCWDQCSKWAQFRKQCRKTDETLRRLLAFQTPTAAEAKKDESAGAPGRLKVDVRQPQKDPTVTQLENDLALEISLDSDDEILLHDLPSVEPHEETTVPVVVVEPALEGENIISIAVNTLNNKTGGSHHTGKSFVCQRCGKKFRSPGMFEAHQREHDGLLPFVCKECGKEFKNRLTLRNHMFTHTNESYSCPDCDRKFKYPQLMEEHRMRMHTVQEKRFSCPTCGKEFGRAQTLQVHSLTHTDKRPFKCSECELTFKSETYLKIHQVRHGGVKNFVCPVEDCKKDFFTLSELNFHQRNVHSDDKPHQCNVCSKRFTKKSQLQVHKRTHKNNEKKLKFVKSLELTRQIETKRRRKRQSE